MLVQVETDKKMGGGEVMIDLFNTNWVSYSRPPGGMLSSRECETAGDDSGSPAAGQV